MSPGQAFEQPLHAAAVSFRRLAAIRGRTIEIPRARSAYLISFLMLLARYRSGNAAYPSQLKAEDGGIRIHLAGVRGGLFPDRALSAGCAYTTKSRQGGMDG